MTLADKTKEATSNPPAALYRPSFVLQPSTLCQSCQSSLRALQEIIPTRALVRNQACQVPVVVEDDAIRAWAAAAVDLVRTQDRELIVGARDGEGEAFVVVVPVGGGVYMSKCFWVRGVSGRRASLSGLKGGRPQR